MIDFRPAAILRRNRLWFTLFSLATLLAGCSSTASPGEPGGAGGSSPGGDGGGAGGGSGMVDGGGSGGEDGGPPIIDRPPLDAYACSVTRSMTKIGVENWTSPALLPAQQGGLLARVAGQTTSVLSWSTVLANGTLGAAKTVFDGGSNFIHGLSVAGSGDRYTLVWSRSIDGRVYSAQGLYSAQVDGSGSIVSAAREIVAGDARNDQAQLVVSSSGYALTWLQTTGSQAQLRFALLDASGALSGASLVLRAGNLNLSSLLAVDGGYLLTYHEYAGGKSRPYLLALDAAGTPLQDPLQLSPDGYGGSLIRRGEEVLAAWSENQGSQVDQRRATILRLGRFDQKGNALGPSAPLQAPVLDRANNDARWIALGNDVGLVWAEGKIIYICAGCFPDNHLKFAIFDGANFTRKSDVLDLPSPVTAGLTDPQMVGAASNLLLVSSITYHVSAEGASATIACPERGK